jgi:small-conductance mechanosensitive channel
MNIDKFTIILALAALPVSWGIQYVVLFLLDRVLRRRKIHLEKGRVSKLLALPSFTVLVLIFWQALLLTSDALPNQERDLHTFERLYIFAIAWFVMRFMTLAKVIASAKFDMGSADNLKARKVQTQFQFLEKAMSIVIGVIAVALVLMTFDSVRRIGGSLIASAGLAGIILGFAAQKTLGTFLSGFQVAFTQPIRMDDVVVVEGEWGQIEEITLSYVVIKIWDQRRLIVPISYFTEKPFQNWTRSQSALLGYVFLNFDFSLSVDSIRGEFNRILNATPLWDKKTSVLQVTDATEKNIQVRFLMSARNSPESFDLRCYVREKMVEYIQNTNPKAFPRLRLEEREDLV